MSLPSLNPRSSGRQPRYLPFNVSTWTRRFLDCKETKVPTFKLASKSESAGLRRLTVFVFPGSSRNEVTTLVGISLSLVCFILDILSKLLLAIGLNLSSLMT